MNPAITAAAPAAQSGSGPKIRWEGHMSDGVGVTYGLTPLAFLSVEPDHLLLSGNRGTYRFSRGAIVKLGRGGFYPWFFRGIRFRHTVAGYPAELLFRPLGTPDQEILARLRALGYGGGGR
jgi:hypothetical protein